MTSIEFYQTPLRATKMAPLRGSYSPSNALAGYQNGTATRFLLKFYGRIPWHKMPADLPGNRGDVAEKTIWE